VNRYCLPRSGLARLRAVEGLEREAWDAFLYHPTKASPYLSRREERLVRGGRHRGGWWYNRSEARHER